MNYRLAHPVGRYLALEPPLFKLEIVPFFTAFFSNDCSISRWYAIATTDFLFHRLKNVMGCARSIILTMVRKCPKKQCNRCRQFMGVSLSGSGFVLDVSPLRAPSSELTIRNPYRKLIC